MSIPKIPEPARVVVSVLASDERVLDLAKSPLMGQLGPVEEEVGPISFNFTSYYDAELGPGIRDGSGVSEIWWTEAPLRISNA